MSITTISELDSSFQAPWDPTIADAELASFLEVERSEVDVRAAVNAVATELAREGSIFALAGATRTDLQDRITSLTAESDLAIEQVVATRANFTIFLVGCSLALSKDNSLTEEQYTRFCTLCASLLPEDPSSLLLRLVVPALSAMTTHDRVADACVMNAFADLVKDKYTSIEAITQVQSELFLERGAYKTHEFVCYVKVLREFDEDNDLPTALGELLFKWFSWSRDCLLPLLLHQNCSRIIERMMDIDKCKYWIHLKGIQLAVSSYLIDKSVLSTEQRNLLNHLDEWIEETPPRTAAYSLAKFGKNMLFLTPKPDAPHYQQAFDALRLWAYYGSDYQLSHHHRAAGFAKRLWDRCQYNLIEQHKDDSLQGELLRTLAGWQYLLCSEHLSPYSGFGVVTELVSEVERYRARAFAESMCDLNPGRQIEIVQQIVSGLATYRRSRTAKENPHRLCLYDVLLVEIRQVDDLLPLWDELDFDQLLALTQGDHQLFLQLLPDLIQAGSDGSLAQRFEEWTSAPQHWHRLTHISEEEYVCFRQLLEGRLSDEELGGIQELRQSIERVKNGESAEALPALLCNLAQSTSVHQSLCALEFARHLRVFLDIVAKAGLNASVLPDTFYQTPAVIWLCSQVCDFMAQHPTAKARPLSPPRADGESIVTPVTSQHAIYGSLHVMSSETQGRRPMMQDAPIHGPVIIDGVQMLLAGVADGHGTLGTINSGGDVAQFIKENILALAQEIADGIAPQSIEHRDAIVVEVMGRTVAKLQENLLTELSLDPEARESGATLQFVVVDEDGGKIYSFNLGDSLAFVGSRERPEERASCLSYNPSLHPVGREFEAARIRDEGGELLPNGRVVPRNQRVDIGVCRALGHTSEMYRGTLSSVPAIVIRPYNPASDVVLIASDGLWDLGRPDRWLTFIREGGSTEELLNYVQPRCPKGLHDNTTLVAIIPNPQQDG